MVTNDLTQNETLPMLFTLVALDLVCVKSRIQSWSSIVFRCFHVTVGKTFKKDSF